MKAVDLTKIINAYFPVNEHDVDTLRLARLMGEDVERQTRQAAVSIAYSMAHEISKTPSENS